MFICEAILKKKYFILPLIFYYITLSAQIDRETRAVWLASNFRLDWPPPTYNQEKQKEALKDILDNLESKNYNTIYFQVRFNGTVLFESSYEPWSYYLTGIVGGKPDYDPLEFIIEEAHKRGMELHAWFNMVRCYSGTEKNVFNYPQHLITTHPNWVQKIYLDGQTSYWLDPGLPEVRKYLTDLVVEVAKKYDVDGIHLDYIRYPSREMDDSFSYSIYGEDKNKAQWRRDNITDIVGGIKKQITQINKDIKLGAAPIGVYINKPNASGMQAFSEVYQESRLWLKEGLVDYLAPQIYWDFDNNPKFNLLVDDWVNDAFGRNIVVGIASYKEEVKNETPRMIDYTRKAGAEGVAFFRYEHIKNQNYFDSKAFPAPMQWKEHGPPIAPANLSAEILNEETNKVKLTWAIPQVLMGSEEIKYYAIYNLDKPTDELSSENLFKVIPAEKNELVFTIINPAKINYYFHVRSLDKFWDESSTGTNIVTLKIPQFKNIAQNITSNLGARLLKQNGINYIVVESDKEDSVIVTANNIEKQINKSAVKKGINIIELEELLKDYNSLQLWFVKKQTKVNLKKNN